MCLYLKLHLLNNPSFSSMETSFKITTDFDYWTPEHIMRFDHLQIKGNLATLCLNSKAFSHKAEQFQRSANLGAASSLRAPLPTSAATHTQTPTPRVRQHPAIRSALQTFCLPRIGHTLFPNPISDTYLLTHTLSASDTTKSV